MAYFSVHASVLWLKTAGSLRAEMERGGRLSALNMNASQIIEFGREYVFSSKFILRNKGILYLGSSDVYIVLLYQHGLVATCSFGLSSSVRRRYEPFMVSCCKRTKFKLGKLLINNRRLLRVTIV